MKVLVAVLAVLAFAGFAVAVIVAAILTSPLWLAVETVRSMRGSGRGR